MKIPWTYQKKKKEDSLNKEIHEIICYIEVCLYSWNWPKSKVNKIIYSAEDITVFYKT